ncbi:MAG: ABC transporter permease [Promethearchaeota archaeon]
MAFTKLSVIWVLCRKNISLYIKKGPVLIFGLLFPFFMTLAWVIGRDLTPSQIFVGIVVMTTFFTSTAISPVILPQETREKSLERQLIYPISILQLLLGIFLASFLYSFLISLFFMVMFTFIFSIPIISIMQIFLVVAGIGLMDTVGSLLGLLASSYPSDMTSDVMIIINLIKFPLVFIGGIFIPLNSASLSLFIISLFSPVTFFTDVLKYAVNGDNVFSIGINILVLIIWISILLISNFIIHEATMPRRLAEKGIKLKKKVRNEDCLN